MNRPDSVDDGTQSGPGEQIRPREKTGDRSAKPESDKEPNGDDGARSNRSTLSKGDNP